MSLAFLPFAFVFIPITVVFGALLPASLPYGVAGLMEIAERIIDLKYSNADRTRVLVKKSFFIKAILAQLVSTFTLVATTSSFYLKCEWPEAVKGTLDLIRALQYDFTFNLAFAFGWPELPGAPTFHFTLAIEVLGFQFFMSNFFRIYLGAGLDTAGSATIKRVFQTADISGIHAKSFKLP